jgi:hypothetical protein
MPGRIGRFEILEKVGDGGTSAEGEFGLDGRHLV